MSFQHFIHSSPPPSTDALSPPLHFSLLSISIQPLASWSSPFPSPICLSASTRPLQVSGRRAVYSSRSSRRSTPREAPEKPLSLGHNKRAHALQRPTVDLWLCTWALFSSGLFSPCHWWTRRGTRFLCCCRFLGNLISLTAAPIPRGQEN